MRYTYAILTISLCFAVGLADAGKEQASCPEFEAKILDFENPEECELVKLLLLETELGYTYIPPRDKKILRIAPEEFHIYKACLIQKVMKEVKRVDAPSPSTLEEARAFLLNHIIFAELPTSCFEYNGVYFFSIRVGTDFQNTYYAGYAISSKEPLIYKWGVSDLVQFMNNEFEKEENEGVGTVLSIQHRRKGAPIIGSGQTQNSLPGKGSSRQGKPGVPGL